MFKRLGFVFLASLIFAGCTLPSLPTGKKAGLQVTSFPAATVFLDGKSLGVTPLPRQENLKPGSVTVKIVPQDPTLTPYEVQVNLIGGAVTVIDHKFNANPEMASSYVLSFEPISNKKSNQIAITTMPSAVSVSIDNIPQDFTPASIDTVNAGEHRILLTSPGYEDKLILAQSINGYKLIINAQLAKKVLGLATPEPTSEATPSASPSISLTPTPTKKATPTPAKTATSSATLPPKPYATVKQTDTGFLRVRQTPGGTEVAQVKPGESFPYLGMSDSPTGWAQITYQPGKDGWVSSQYVTIHE